MTNPTSALGNCTLLGLCNRAGHSLESRIFVVPITEHLRPIYETAAVPPCTHSGQFILTELKLHQRKALENISPANRSPFVQRIIEEATASSADWVMLFDARRGGRLPQDVLMLISHPNEKGVKLTLVTCFCAAEPAKSESA